MIKSSILRTLSVIGLALLWNAQASAASVYVTPAATSVGLGTDVSVTIDFDGFVDYLTGGGFTIGFNSSVLQVASFTWDADFSDPFFSFVGAIDNVAGTITDSTFASFTSGPVGTVATIVFSTVGTGVSDILLMDTSDPVGLGQWADGFTPLFVADGSLTLTSAQVSVVPIPPAIWLLGSGLIGLFGLGRRQKAGTTA